VLYADNVTNINLSAMIANHFNKKVELKNVELTIGMRRGVSPNIYILNSNTNEILQLET
jgi:NDP-sugar pyrophosphorylase family protein